MSQQDRFESLWIELRNLNQSEFVKLIQLPNVP